MNKLRLNSLPGLILLVFFLVGTDAGRGQMNPASGLPASAPSFRVLVVASRVPDHAKMIAAAQPYLAQIASRYHFTLDFTDDTSLINDSNLTRYQVFVMLQLAPFDMSYGQQDALQKFAEAGKGFVIIHASGLTGKSFIT